MGLTTDHYHHYTYGDTDEPDVSEQLEPIHDDLNQLQVTVNKLVARVEELEWRVKELSKEAVGA